MVNIDSTTARQGFNKFTSDLQNLTGKVGNEHTSKACLVCDRLLEWNDTEIISLSRLRKLRDCFVGQMSVFQGLHQNIKADYTYRGNGSQDWMEQMFLSPRGHYCPDKEGFQCCVRCVKRLNTNQSPYRVVLPRFAIANGSVFGEAPIELTELNDAELALVSKARTNKHVFAFYGGAHKCMRGWHNLYENDVDGIARTLNQVSNFGGDTVILCILLGPFTPLQKQFIKNKMMVRPAFVLRALEWLKRNNKLYKHITIPQSDDIARPMFIDNTQNVESQDTNIESRMEYTVVFPETDNISTTNGGFASKAEFRKEVVDAMDRTSQTRIISRSTPNRLIDYLGDALLQAFPLQFPYGVGLPPETRSNRSDSKERAMSNLEYLQHLQHQSIRHFHRADFILVLHNIYERKRAVSVSYLRCKNTFDGDSFGEHIAGMSLERLKNAIDRTHAGLEVDDWLAKYFLKSVDAVCKSLGHTSDAAKTARLKMFADNVRFGTAAVFLTVSPDDSNCLRIQIYVQHKCGDAPDPRTASDDEIKADFDLSVQLRQLYPGMCAFDFQQIIELMIEHILGWDRKNQVSYDIGGAFGVLEAWNATIEEQSRKSLHAHWILYVKGWSKLLHGLYSQVDSERRSAVQQLRSYVDSIVSTKLFGLETRGDITRKAYEHECISHQRSTMPELCSHQDLRNLRYSHGQSSFKGDNILKCGECHVTFSIQTLVENVMRNHFRSSDNLISKMRLAVKRQTFSRIQSRKMSRKEANMAKFMTHALTNLHASTHTATCFKKGNECRSKLPQPPCLITKVHFDEENPLTWWTWMGNKESKIPFITECQRHKFDVFMNQYHPDLSLALGSNTNVQCGIGGACMYYVTLYVSKSTNTEDKYAYALMARNLYKYIRCREENVNSLTDGIEFENGARILLTAVLNHTESVVVSAPMAWFLMRNQSRFLFSHTHGYAPFYGFLKKSVFSSIISIHGEAFMSNPMNDYLYRPQELEDLNWYEFVAYYEMVQFSEKNKHDIMRFSSHAHPLFHSKGIREREHMVTPLISYTNFPCASEFEGNIMSPSIIPNAAMEKYARMALCLFVPFRDKDAFNPLQGTCFTEKLRVAVHANVLSGISIVRLQNIQNCHNMTKVGRQKDLLERVTVPLADPASPTKTNDNDDLTQRELEDHIDMCLTELFADLDEDHRFRSPDEPMSLYNIRKKGKDNCGFEGIRPMDVDQNARVFEISDRNGEGTETTTHDDLSQPANTVTNMDRIITKARLTQLSIQVIVRHVSNIDEVEHINPNGTAESVQEWAKVMFRDPDTDQVDMDQQRAFEVILSMFLLTFHQEAARNEGLQAVGTLDPRNRAPYNKLKSQLKALSGMRNKQQLIMFLTGPGGSGKTRVINAILAYAKGFCKALNYVFDKRMVVVTAMTGVAATLINGETLHSAAKLFNKKVTTDHIDEWSPTRVVIVDEISFATSDVLTKLNEKLKQLKEKPYQKYGDLHMVFTGDFSQLQPVSGKPLYYETNFALWHDSVNCFNKLSGQHRFKDDMSFGNIMLRMSEGNPTEADIAVLNTRVVGSDHPDAPTEKDLPSDLTYAVHCNHSRSAINNGIFYEHIKKTHSTDPNKPPPFHTLIIRSDDLTWKTNKKQFGPSAKHTLWSECSDSDIKTDGEKGKHVDVFLKLTTNIPLMYTENDDVPNGIANGTLCRLVKVVLLPNVTLNDFKVINIDGYYVRTIDASKVDYLVCKFMNSDRTFHIVATHVKCQINMPIELIPGEKVRKIVRATVNRFPLLVNYATTGHKLQGQTVSSLYISEWYYGANWPYVVLSRVRTLQGLFLRTPLKLNHDFSHEPRLTQMLAAMQQRAPCPYDPEEW